MPPKKGKEKEIEKSPEELQIQKLADDVLDYVKVDKASFINETKMLTKMVEDGTDMDSPGAEDGNTPLITAAISNYMKACKILIDDGHADVNKAGLGGMTALHHSCRMGEQVDLMLYLVDEAKCDIHAVDDVGNTAIHHAALVGNLRAADILAGKGVKHDAKNFKEQTAYMVAAMCNQPGVMDVLFKRKVNVNAQDALGNTALHHAAALGVMKSVNKCIADGAKLDVLNKARQMPIDMANGTAVKKLLTTKMAK